MYLPKSNVPSTCHLSTCPGFNGCSVAANGITPLGSWWHVPPATYLLALIDTLMMSSPNFKSTSHRYDDFTLPEARPESCQYAQPYSEWVERLYSAVAQEPSITKINQNK